MKSDLIDLEVRVCGATERALGIANERDPKGPLIWLPLSQIEHTPPDHGGGCTVTLPEWLAIEKGLV